MTSDPKEIVLVLTQEEALVLGKLLLDADRDVLEDDLGFTSYQADTLDDVFDYLDAELMVNVDPDWDQLPGIREPECKRSQSSCTTSLAVPVVHLTPTRCTATGTHTATAVQRAHSATADHKNLGERK